MEDYPQVQRLSIFYQSGTFLTVVEHTLTNHYHLQFTLGLTLGVVHSIDLDKCLMTCVNHYSII